MALAAPRTTPDINSMSLSYQVKQVWPHTHTHHVEEEGEEGEEGEEKSLLIKVRCFYLFPSLKGVHSESIFNFLIIFTFSSPK